MSERSSKARRFDRDVEGILLLDKPVGLSSNAALQQARVLYRAVKAGHAGSLDPLASGMLPICFGEATKVCGFLLDSKKSYRFTAKLGERTATGDAEGEIIEHASVPVLTEDSLRATLDSFLGEQLQVPPMYSALKHKGERLYELARRGEVIDRPARTIFIESMELNAIQVGSMEITVRCSKGTYVRTLAEDIARRLGTVAHLTSLRRLTVDPFASNPMYTLGELDDCTDREVLEGKLLKADRAVQHLPSLTFDAFAEESLLHGQAVPSRAKLIAGEYVRLYSEGGKFLGLGESVGDGSVQPRRLWANRQ